MRNTNNKSNSFQSLSPIDQQLLLEYMVRQWRGDESRSDAEKLQDARKKLDEAFISFSDGFNAKELGFDRWISLLWRKGPIASQGFTVNGNGPLVESFTRRRLAPLPYRQRVKRLLQSRYYSAKYRILFALGNL